MPPKWITFDEPIPSPSGKTMTWRVKNGLVILGDVKWYGPWRKYAFFPRPLTVYEPDCLKDLAQFCMEQTMQHKGVRDGQAT